MVRYPGDYPWSSYRTNAEGTISFMLTAHPAYLALARDDHGRRLAYGRLFADEIPASHLQRIRGSINSGVPLGDDAFIAELERQTGRRLSLSKGGRPRKPGTRAQTNLRENRGLAPV